MLGFGGSGEPHTRGHSPFITLSSQFNRPADELIPHEVPFAQVAEEGGSMEVLKRLEQCPYGDVPESGGKAPADKLHEGLEGVLKIAPLVDYIHGCRVQPKDEMRETNAAVNRDDAATSADPTNNNLRSRRGDEAEDNGGGTTPSWNNTPEPAFDTMELERFVNMRIVDRRSSSSASSSSPGVPASSSELRFVPGSDPDTSHSANMLPNNGTHSTLHPTATTSLPPPTSPSSPPIPPSSHREAQKRARMSSGEGFARSARRFTQHDVERHWYLGVRFTIPLLPSHPCSLRTVTKVKSFLDTFVEWVAKSKKATEDKQVFGDWAASLAIPVPADKPAAGSGVPGMAWPDFASLGNATAQLVDSAKTLVSLCRRSHAWCII